MRAKLMFLGLAFLLILAPVGLLLAQPLATAVTVPATAPVLPQPELIGWTLCLSILANEFMRRLKKSALVPWMTAGTAKANVIVAAALSAVAAGGIHWTFDPITGVGTITGLTWTGVAHFGGDWIKQWTLMHFVYHATKEPYGPAAAGG